MKTQAKKYALFLAKFFLVFLVLQALLLAANLNFMERAIASVEAQALGVQSNGNIVFIGNNSYSIDANCTGLLSGAIIAAIVFSFRKPEIKQKIAIALSAGMLLFLLNIPRVFVVLWTAKYFGAQAAETVHVTTWFSTAAFILLFWYFLTKKITKTRDFSKLL